MGNKKVWHMKLTCPTCKRRIKIKKSRDMRCRCNHIFNYESLCGKPYIYLVDANIILYALNKNERWGEQCSKVLNELKIATTKRVYAEVKQYNPDYIPTYLVKKIVPEIAELHANRMKQPTEADLSLIQAAATWPEIKGIITYDSDIKAVAASGIVDKMSASMRAHLIVGNAQEILKRENR
jgi:rRNA-processing protein FCF1